ncbi:hypothetical protein [Rhodovulum sulfidophilum]|uniref:hypothetical protein n=1 Tax=Rhodovulum sulfidophilum TaxID=35806 RepID=UPI001920D7F8|nr:hypothetical protein [Rhodovulum sulfidophilum]MBL3561501.1 hypothetical protein [Rhodovulum sulfidophilum]
MRLTPRPDRIADPGQSLTVAPLVLLRDETDAHGTRITGSDDASGPQVLTSESRLRLKRRFGPTGHPDRPEMPSPEVAAFAAALDPSGGRLRGFRHR